MNKGSRNGVYFLGIGGIGMSALARFMQSRGFEVSGYDLTPSPLTRQLEAEGMSVHYKDRPDLIPQNIGLAVYTPAVPQTLGEFKALADSGVRFVKRSELLGEISRSHKTVAISGSHGKTTTTALITHLLASAGKRLSAFIGGVANNFNSNVVVGGVDDEFVVAEADEYDRSFLRLSPFVSVVTSIGADHLDIYGNEQNLVGAFNDFVSLTSSEGLVVCREGLPIKTDRKMVTFGMGKADYVARDIRIENLMTTFDVLHQGSSVGRFAVPLFGEHNVMNALAAVIVCLNLGVSADAVSKGLKTFKGVRRRFDMRVCSECHCYIDDYAHHPDEIRSTLAAARMLFPDRRMTVVFQPHLFSRTRDLMNEFADSLSLADNVILMDIYPAREKPIEGVTSAALMDRMALKDKMLCSKEALLRHIDTLRPELLITMGAGDIDRFVEPIEKNMKTW